MGWASSQAASSAAGSVLQNFRPEKYLSARKALSELRRGVSDFRHLDIGNSTTGPLYAESISKYSPSARMGAYLRDAGINARNNTYYGGVSKANATAEPRLVVPATWVYGGYESFGGLCVKANGGTTDAVAFTPSDDCDEFVVYYAQANYSGGAGNWSWQIDAGAVTNVAKPATGKVQQTTITTSLGAHTLYLRNASAAPSEFQLLGVRARNTAVKEYSIHNGGMGGSTVDTWIQDTASKWWLPMISALAPHLVTVRGDINHWRAASPPAEAAFKASYRTLFSFLLSIGANVLVETDPPSQEATVSTDVQRRYANWIIDVATEPAYGFAINDHHSALSSWTAQGGTASGFYSDNLHGTSWCYDEIGRRKAAGVLQLGV